MEKQAIVVLASYDYESLQLTLLALEHTVEEEVPIVIILNGANSIAASKVELAARRWAASKPALRSVVRPLSYGQKPLFALQEIIRNLPSLHGVDRICKIDDDVIPLKKGWLSSLARCYDEKIKATNNKLGFITGLLNNNCWGFGELVELADKREEYRQIMNYQSVAGGNREKIVQPGEIDQGMCGTVWQYPYLARWIHSWTSVTPENYIALTDNQPVKEIPLDIHYSIGCIYSSKDLWLKLNPAENTFDELLIHNVCQRESLTKWAVMSEPMIHLFYFSQRLVNHDQLDDISNSLAIFFNDDRFKMIERRNIEDLVAQLQEDSTKNALTSTQSANHNPVVDRLNQYYQILNKWLRIKQRNHNLSEVLLRQGYRNIAIYGAGELGKNLFGELQQTPVKVHCFINQGVFETNYIEYLDMKIQVMDMQHFSDYEKENSIDAVVVSPIFDFAAIKD